jgi:hypothetical protein
MITSEITFFYIGTERPSSEDQFFDAVGLCPSAREDFSKSLDDALVKTQGAIKSFKKQFTLPLELTSKHYTCALISNLKPLKYIYVAAETFFINKRLKRRIVESWRGRLPEGWFIEIENFEGFYKFYLGDLRLLRRYFLQDENVPPVSLPYQIGFEDESCREEFRWREVECPK